MAATNEPGFRAAAASPPTDDWAAQVADTIESVVGAVRDKTTVKLETVARAVVFGILIAVMGLAALVLVTIVLVRLGTYVAPVWAVYAVLGTLFTLVGLFLWSRRQPDQAKGS